MKSGERAFQRTRSSAPFFFFSAPPAKFDPRCGAPPGNDDCRSAPSSFLLFLVFFAEPLVKSVGVWSAPSNRPAGQMTGPVGFSPRFVASTPCSRLEASASCSQVGGVDPRSPPAPPKAVVVEKIRADSRGDRRLGRAADLLFWCPERRSEEGRGSRSRKNVRFAYSDAARRRDPCSTTVSVCRAGAAIRVRDRSDPSGAGNITKSSFHYFPFPALFNFNSIFYGPVSSGTVFARRRAAGATADSLPPCGGINNFALGGRRTVARRVSAASVGDTEHPLLARPESERWPEWRGGRPELAPRISGVSSARLPRGFDTPVSANVRSNALVRPQRQPALDLRRAPILRDAPRFFFFFLPYDEATSSLRNAETRKPCKAAASEHLMQGAQPPPRLFFCA